MTRALPVALRHRAGQAGRAMFDQVFSSGTQLLLLVLVARREDAATIGAVTLALLVHGLLLGMVRAAVGQVVLLRCREALPRWRTEASIGLLLGLLAGAAVGVSALGAGLVVGGETGRYLLLVALAAIPVNVQDVVRHVAYGRGLIGQAVAVDGAWMGTQVVASAALIAVGSGTPSWFVLAWMAGSVPGAAAGATHLRHVRPDPANLARWWTEERARSTGFVADFVVSTGMLQGSFILLSVILPIEDFAALRVAAVSVSPLANLLAGVRVLTLAHLASLRRQPGRARRRAAGFALGLTPPAFAYGLVLVLLPATWGAELFGETWADARVLVGFLAAAEVLRLSAFAAVDLIKVIGSPADLVRTRLVSSVILVAGLLVGALVAGAHGAAVSTALSYLVATILWWRTAWSVGSAQEAATTAAEAPRSDHVPVDGASASSR